MPDEEMSSLPSVGMFGFFPSGKNFVSTEFYGNQPIKAGTLMGGRKKFLKVKLDAERPGLNW